MPLYPLRYQIKIYSIWNLKKQAVLRKGQSVKNKPGDCLSYSRGLLDLLRLVETTLLLSSCFMNTQ